MMDEYALRNETPPGPAAARRGHNPLQRKMRRLEELDGLRGLLALWVAGTHTLIWAGFSNPRIPWPLSHVWPEFIGAQPAVHVFIILSGFAISFLLHARPQPYHAFITGRFFRLYPTYLVCLILGIATVPLTPFVLDHALWRDNPFFTMVRDATQDERAHLAEHILWHVTMLHGLLTHAFSPGANATLLPQAWSLSLEWQYYVAALAIAWLLRSGIGILTITGVAWIGLRHSQTWANPNIAFLPPQLPLFLLGILSYHLYAWFCSRGAKASDFYLLPVCGLVMCAVVLSSWSVAVVIWAVSFGCIFVEGTGGLARALTVLRGILVRPSLQWLGAVSYPLYLIHWPVIVVFLTVVLKCRPSTSSTQSLLLLLFVGLPLMLASADLLHRTIEMPIMRWGRERAKRETTATNGYAASN